MSEVIRLTLSPPESGQKGPVSERPGQERPQIRTSMTRCYISHTKEIVISTKSLLISVNSINMLNSLCLHI